MILTVIDIETTGLDPHADTILEYAAVRWNYVNDSIAGFDHYVRAIDGPVRGQDRALAMNERTGLLDQVRGEVDVPKTAKRVRRFDLAWAIRRSLGRGQVDGHPARLAGANIVGFDIPFIRDLLEVYSYGPWRKLAHYRVLDIGSLAAGALARGRELARDGGLVPGAGHAAAFVGLDRGDWGKVVRHTALGDAMLECETIRRLLGRPGLEPRVYLGELLVANAKSAAAAEAC